MKPHEQYYQEQYRLGVLMWALVAGIELNPWQPIETAPKDRRILLLYEDGDVRIDWWHHESQQGGNKIVAWMELRSRRNDL